MIQDLWNVFHWEKLYKHWDHSYIWNLIAGENVEEPALAATGQDGAAEPAVKSAERDPRQTNGVRGADQDQSQPHRSREVSGVWSLWMGEEGGVKLEIWIICAWFFGLLRVREPDP